MIRFTTVIQKFGQQGDKTGWTYITIPAERAQSLVPGNKKGFRVKGKLDTLKIEMVSVLPMGGGDFIIPLNADIRKNIRKPIGETINVQLSVDDREVQICAELLECLDDEPAAKKYFGKLPPSHQKYYSKWIESAKTEATKAKRIAQAVNGMARGLNYGEMLRLQKEDNNLLKK